MIFDTNYSRYDDNTFISPYELNMEGALLHVYETELNYNAIMKSAAISELRYYQDTGKDLFVNEAGAFKDFIGKIKEFFKNIIRRIKEIFNKFVLIIGKNITSNKGFVKKFKNAYTGDLNKTIKYNGYTFEELDDYINFFTNPSNLEFLYKMENDKIYDMSFSLTKANVITSHMGHPSYDEDSKNTIINKYRGKILDDGNTEYDSDEFKKKLHEKCYGEKKEFEAIVSDQLNFMENANNSISKAEKIKNAITKNIESIIGVLENYNKDTNDKWGKKVLTEIEILKSQSQDIMVAFSVISNAIKDRIPQAKSICMQALKNKKDKNNAQEARSESAIYDNIFSDINII